MCKHNKAVALAAGRMDLVKIWDLMSLIGSPLLSSTNDPDAYNPWAAQPFGQTMVQDM